MTLKQLEAFYLAATLGSFSLAAQRAHVTQSSLSKRIAELETYLDTELFDRSSKRAQLTEAGSRLLPTAAQMLELKEGVKATVSSPTTLAGTCRFGISELGALTWLPRLVARVREQHPQLALHPHVDLGRRLERQVARGELDFAIVPGPPDDQHITAHVVGEVRFAWTAAVGRIKGRKVLTLDELFALSLQQIGERGLALLPQHLSEALDALAADPVVAAALGDTLLAQFIALKRDEHTAHARHVGDWELARYAAMF